MLVTCFRPKMHFENFQRAGIPLEAQTLNASTALLKHIFQKRENHFFRTFYSASESKRGFKI